MYSLLTLRSVSTDWFYAKVLPLASQVMRRCVQDEEVALAHTCQTFSLRRLAEMVLWWALVLFGVFQSAHVFCLLCLITLCPYDGLTDS